MVSPYYERVTESELALSFQNSDAGHPQSDLVASAFDLATHTLRARRASLLLRAREHPDELGIALAHGINARVIRESRVAIGTPIAGWVAQARQPVLVGDRSDTALLPLTRRADYSTCSFACAPVLSAQESIGVLNVTDKAGNHAFDSGDLRMLIHFANHLADCLVVQNRCQQIWEMARRDPLTGLLNRQAFAEFLQEQAARIPDACEPMSCLMIDLDDFKAINDAHGHQIGDIVLTVAARAIEAQVRPEDKVFRYGGDEFVVFLADTEWNQARVIAARIRYALSSSARGQELTGRALSATIGVATYPHDVHSVIELTERADQGMYFLKRRLRAAD